MRVFVTGASGWIGSAVLPELLSAGHEVLGLARSSASAAKVEATGAVALQGGLGDLEVLAQGARDTDAVIHLAYHHDFSQMDAAAELDRAALSTIADQLRGTDRPFVIAAGLLGLPTGREVTEDDRPDPEGWHHPRLLANRMALEWAREGINTALVRLSPSVHGAGDDGFVAEYVRAARRTGVVGYVEDGANHWPAVHRSDAAALFRLAVEQPEPGAVLHAGAENVTIRELADAVSRTLSLPVGSVPAAQAVEHFGWLGGFLPVDVLASSERTRERYGWTPTGPTLLADIEAGAYPG